MVGRTLTTWKNRRRISILLAISLLPMLTFMGHWPEAVPIPGTDEYLSIPFAGRPLGDHHEEGGEHEQHCHGDAASCTDVPALAGVSVGLAQEFLAVFTAGGLLWMVALHWWRPRRSNAIVPELLPPRVALG